MSKESSHGAVAGLERNLSNGPQINHI